MTYHRSVPYRKPTVVRNARKPTVVRNARKPTLLREARDTGSRAQACDRTLALSAIRTRAHSCGQLEQPSSRGRAVLDKTPEFSLNLELQVPPTTESRNDAHL
jgi:hypothetical protein